ncbi:MAG TPA: tetratricopeptide repeat protein [Bryobacteraceae bacterium]|nr:tetratricopeptide repeat protein [Bryobacteraceae bacterium]
MLSFSTAIAFFLAGSFAAGFPVEPGAGQQPFSIPASTFRAPGGDVPAPVATPAKPQISPETRGDIYMARKMYREAIDMYREGPANSAVLANKIGIAFHQLLLLDLAKKSYERSIKLDKKYPEAINNLGTVYYSRKNFRRAIGYYKRALHLSPPSASIYSNLGTAYFGRKDYKRAAECYQRAMQIDPDVFERRSSFGTLMMERSVEERATFHLYLAKMYAKAGASERALIYLRKALEEGVKDREKIPDIPEFAALKTDPAFKQLLIDNPKPL